MIIREPVNIIHQPIHHNQLLTKLHALVNSPPHVTTGKSSSPTPQSTSLFFLSTNFSNICSKLG